MADVTFNNFFFVFVSQRHFVKVAVRKPLKIPQSALVNYCRWRPHVFLVTARKLMGRRRRRRTIYI